MGAAPAIRVVIVDDHVLIREALCEVLERRDGLEVVGVAGEADEAIAVITSVDPDVTLLDLQLGERSGAEVARAVRQRDHSGRVLVLSAQLTAADLREALAAGADGYLGKTVGIASLADGIRRVHSGETVVSGEMLDALLARVREAPTTLGLTPRELDVLQHVVDGGPYSAVAEHLDMSVRTLHKHVERLFRKLGVHDRTALTERALALGLVDRHPRHHVDEASPS